MNREGIETMKTDYIGIDYSLGKSNRDNETGIHYGVIPQYEVLQAWADESKVHYGDFYCPNCEKISYNKKCEFCKKELEVEIKLPEKQVMFFGKKKKKESNQQKIVCPRCKSIQTKLTFSAEWD